MTLLSNVHIGLLCPEGEVWREEFYTVPHVNGLVGTVASHLRQALMDTFSIVVADLQTHPERAN